MLEMKIFTESHPSQEGKQQQQTEQRQGERILQMNCKEETLHSFQHINSAERKFSEQKHNIQELCIMNKRIPWMEVWVAGIKAKC